jgi:putative PEP-CTERM system histidine kinase
MNLLGVTGYGAAGLAFLVLTALLITSWEGRQVGARLIVASAVTAVWSFVLAAESWLGSMPWLVVYLAEVARAAAWLLVLTDLAAVAAPRLLIVSAHVLWLGLLAIGLAAPVLPQLGMDIDPPSWLLSRAGLGLALMGLILLDQIYRHSTQPVRRTLRYFVVGIGGMFVYDLFLFSQAELVRGIFDDSWNARGIVNSFAVPLIALAVRNNPQWSLDIFVSRQVVFYTTTLVAVGIYLVVMGLGGYVVRDPGGSWGEIGQILFFAGAAVVLASLVTSRALRRQAAVFISKHFYSNKYDYRIEWLRFIQTVSSSSEEDIRRTSVRAVAQIFSSPGGILFLRDEQGRQFVPATGWPVRVDTVVGVAPVRVDSELVRFVHEKQWIIDLHEYRRIPDFYQNIELPDWLRANPTLRIVSPMLELDRLAGFFVLYDPPPPFELTYEDRDLLKTVGRHVATQLAQRDADRKLAESRQFEAYNRLTAFMMHDLKNSVAQLQLIVANAERHKRKPEFIEDTVGTIANTVDRMNRLIDQIRNAPTNARTQVIRLDELITSAVARCSLRQPVPLLHREDGHAICVKADAERLSAVLEHVIRNAQDAAPEGQVSVRVTEVEGEAVIVVTDTGQGMDPEFVRERLFRPFDSTKGSKGMGIGAYQTREYVQMLGGHVQVQSTPGQGTSFSITLPGEPCATPGSTVGGMVTNA